MSTGAPSSRPNRAAPEPTNTYDRVLQLPLDGVAPNPPEFMLQFNNQQLKGTDDIAFAMMPAGRQLYVVVDPPSQQTTKHVLVYNTDVVANPLVLRDLQQTTTIRLAHNTATRRVMVAYEDIYRVGMLNADDVVMDEFVPVQIGPISIAMAPDQKHVYVLNYWSNTLSSIRAEMFSPGETLPLPPLVAYRAGVLNAFADLLGGLLQYLKDCFCDHLLVDCPTCDRDHKLYLASISIKNNKVYKVCNFSQRKDVHSFPTCRYWLSAVPVLPFIRTAVEEICCAALPGLFGRYTATTPSPPVNTTLAPKNPIDSGPVRNAATRLRESDFKRTVLEQVGKLKVGKEALLDPIWNPPQESIRATPEITHTDVSGQNLADARRRLQDARVEVVHEEEYDPRKAGPNLGRYITSPARLREGDRVTLITREGKVLFYARAPEASPDVAALRNDVATNKVALDQTVPRLADLQTRLDASNDEALQLRRQMNRREADLLATQQAHQTELQARDARIAELQNAVRDVQSSAQTMRDIENRVERLERRPPDRDEDPIYVDGLSLLAAETGYGGLGLRGDLGYEGRVVTVQGKPTPTR